MPVQDVSQTPRVLLLISGKKAEEIGQARIDAIIEAMQPAQVTLEKTDAPEHAENTVRAQADNFDCIAVGGGDGTLHAMAAVLCEAARPLLVIPLGTANDFARTLDIPRDPVEAAALLNEGEARRIDLGEVNGIPFFNVASIGLSVDIAERLAGVKKRWGVLSYLGGFFVVWRARRTFRVRISCDGEWVSQRSIQVSVGNGRYHGGGISVADDASIEDGLLDVYALAPQPLWQLIWMLPALLSGEQKYWRTVTTLRGREVSLVTRKPHRVNADGELVSRTPAEFRIRRHALEAIVPKK